MEWVPEKALRGAASDPDVLLKEEASVPDSDPEEAVLDLAQLLKEEASDPASALEEAASAPERDMVQSPHLQESVCFGCWLPLMAAQSRRS